MSNIEVLHSIEIIEHRDSSTALDAQLYKPLLSALLSNIHHLYLYVPIMNDTSK